MNKVHFVRSLVVMILLFGGLALSGAVVQAGSDGSADALLESLSLPLCEGIALVAPANPVWIHFETNVSYRWQGEPPETVSRAVLVFDVTLPEWGAAAINLAGFDGFPADLGWAGRAATFAAGPEEVAFNLRAFGDFPGTYNWLVVFYGVDGAPLCRSANGWLDVRSGPQPGPVEIKIDPCSGAPVVVVLAGSPYTGPYQVLVAGDDYTGTDCDEIIHGNDNPNVIHGMGGSDTIYGHGGSDQLYGGGGNDTIEGGAGADFIFGGWDNRGGQHRDDGDDILSDSGGDDNDMLVGGNDNRGGGAGNDGNDSLFDSGGNNDQLAGGNMNNGGGQGNDRNDVIVDAGGNTDVLVGGNVNLIGGSGNDGNDVLTDGGGDNDAMYGGNENTAGGTGDDGSDTLNDGGGYPDLLYGGNRNAYGGIGNDNVDGGVDTLNSLDGSLPGPALNHDTLYGDNDNYSTPNPNPQPPGTGTGSPADVLNCDPADACLQGNME